MMDSFQHQQGNTKKQTNTLKQRVVSICGATLPFATAMAAMAVAAKALRRRKTFGADSNIFCTRCGSLGIFPLGCGSFGFFHVGIQFLRRFHVEIWFNIIDFVTLSVEGCTFEFRTQFHAAHFDRGTFFGLPWT